MEIAKADLLAKLASGEPITDAIRYDAAGGVIAQSYEFEQGGKVYRIEVEGDLPDVIEAIEVG